MFAQTRPLQLFQAKGYTYLGDWSRLGAYDNTISRFWLKSY